MKEVKGITVGDEQINQGPVEGGVPTGCRLVFGGPLICPPTDLVHFSEVRFVDCDIDVEVAALQDWFHRCTFERCRFLGLCLGRVEQRADAPACEFVNCDFTGAEIRVRLGGDETKFTGCAAEYIWTLDGLQLPAGVSGLAVQAERQMNGIMEEIVSSACSGFDRAELVTEAALHAAYDRVMDRYPLREGDAYPDDLYPSLNPPMGWETLIADYFTRLAGNEPD